MDIPMRTRRNVTMVWRESTREAIISEDPEIKSLECFPYKRRLSKVSEADMVVGLVDKVLTELRWWCTDVRVGVKQDRVLSLETNHVWLEHHRFGCRMYDYIFQNWLFLTIGSVFGACAEARRPGRAI